MYSPAPVPYWRAEERRAQAKYGGILTNVACNRTLLSILCAFCATQLQCTKCYGFPKLQKPTGWRFANFFHKAFLVFNISIYIYCSVFCCRHFVPDDISQKHATNIWLQVILQMCTNHITQPKYNVYIHISILGDNGWQQKHMRYICFIYKSLSWATWTMNTSILNTSSQLPWPSYVTKSLCSNISF